MSASKPPALLALRGAIDLVDDGLIALLAARRVLVAAIALVKTRAGLPAADAARERRVQARAQRLARRLGVPAATAQELIDFLIADARRQQRPPCATAPAHRPAPAAHAAAAPRRAPV